ncbi:7191_t:CDS:2 [Gigaspora rosea]|nr:7191_t:CDS:2 [Gigaspora rosea]
MVKAKVRSQVQQYLNPTATPLTPEAIEKLRQNRYQIETHYIYPQTTEIEITSINSSISIPQPEILLIHSLSSARNSEQTNSGVELFKGGDRSESKTINHSLINTRE